MASPSTTAVAAEALLETLHDEAARRGLSPDKDELLEPWVRSLQARVRKSWEHAEHLERSGEQAIFDDYARFLTVEGEDARLRALGALKREVRILVPLWLAPGCRSLGVVKSSRRSIMRILVAG